MFFLSALQFFADISGSNITLDTPTKIGIAIVFFDIGVLSKLV